MFFYFKGTGAQIFQHIKDTILIYHFSEIDKLYDFYIPNQYLLTVLYSSWWNSFVIIRKSIPSKDDFLVIYIMNVVPGLNRK